MSKNERNNDKTLLWRSSLFLHSISTIIPAIMKGHNTSNMHSEQY